MVKVYTKEIIEQLVEGYWYREPLKGWKIETVTISKGEVKREKDRKKLFIAMDAKVWHEGSGSTGIYAGWEDTHTTVADFQESIHGVIAQKPIPTLDERIPQFITTNTYDVIKKLADYTYQHLTGQMLAITGTAGKSTTKNLLQHILSNVADVVATRGNHNTRTGVPLTIACAVNNPDYLIVESAISGLWMRSGGILKKYPPNIALITSIDSGQQKSAYETALFKARVAEGMNNQGIVIINREANEFETLKTEVKKYNKNIITYGIDQTCDSYLIHYEEIHMKAKIKANILGEQVVVQSQLIGKAMAENIIAILTVLKKWGFNIQEMIPYVESYTPTKGIQQFENLHLPNDEQCTLFNDSWNATGVSMKESIRLYSSQSKYYKGKKIAILGRIVDLGDYAKEQHELLADSLLEENVDLVFAHGKEMKHLLRKLPETMIGGYFESSKELANAVAPILSNDDFILLKGSLRASDFRHVKRNLLEAIKNNNKKVKYSVHHPYATKSGAMTFDLHTNEVLGMSGNSLATQNQGVGNILLLQTIMDKVFSGELRLDNVYKPGRQALSEANKANSIPLEKNVDIPLGDLLGLSIVETAPNTLLMLANQVIGSNKKAMKMVRDKGNSLGIPKEAIGNLTGRRISNKKQELTFSSLFHAVKPLFQEYASILNWFALPTYYYKGKVYGSKTNLFHKGIISHGLFYGHLHSIGAVLSSQNNKKLVTVVIGAKDMYDRDQLITSSLNKALQVEEMDVPTIELEVTKPYKMNIIGDTYFGEFYTQRRKRRNRIDALQKYGRNYSFDGIRSLLQDGDYTICNFEAAILKEDDYYLRKQKPFVLLADIHKTLPALKEERIDLVTLANNHLMDGGAEGLNETIKQFQQNNIATIGAGKNQYDAEKPFIKIINGRRIVIFNSYWHRNRMYINFDFYALGNHPGVSNMSGRLLELIELEKEQYPESYIIVIPHWGVDFERVQIQQRKYAHSILNAGADLILGHGPHMLQEIEKVDDKYIVYSIGNGIFNSDGEYNRRFVAPYSFIAQLVYTSKEVELRLYPIYVNNLQTFWQPQFVNEHQLEHCTKLLSSYGTRSLTIKTDDKKRYYYSLLI